VTGYTDVRTNVSRIARQKLSTRSVLSMHIIGAIAFRRIALQRAKAMITQMGFHAMLSGAPPEDRATQLVNPLNAFSLSCGRAGPHGRNGGLPRDWSRRGLPAALAARPPAAACHTGRGHADTEHDQFRRMMRVPGPVLPGRLPPRPRAWLSAKLRWTLLCTPVCWRGRGCTSFAAGFPAGSRPRPGCPGAGCPEPGPPVSPVRPAAPACRRRPASVEGGNGRTCTERPIYAFQPDTAPQPLGAP
jgi:hypothetical protein